MISPQSFAIADVEDNGDAVQAVYDKQTSVTIADVGCDHAYVSIALVNRNIADKVIAMDVRTGPLDIARRNVAESGLSNKIDIRLGDGLEKLVPGEADAIIIAGMGGLLIKGILERGVDVLLYRKKRPVLILQPQSNLKEVRMFLHSHAYHIVCEAMLVEDGKYYTVMKAVPVDTECLHSGSFTEEYSEEEWEYGKYNLVNKNEILWDYLKNERDVLTRVKTKVDNALLTAGEGRSSSTAQRLETVKHELEINKKAQRYYKGE